jgi:hypothetical protein
MANYSPIINQNNFFNQIYIKNQDGGSDKISKQSDQVIKINNLSNQIYKSNYSNRMN